MKKLYIYILLVFSVFLLCSCSKKPTQEEKTEAINNIETNLKNSESNYLNEIPTAPDSDNKKDPNKNGVLDFKDNYTSENNSIEENSSINNKEDINTENQNQEENSTNNRTEENTTKNNPSSNLDENTIKEILKVNNFINPKDYNFSSYINNEAFKNLQTQVSKLNKNAKLLIKDNCISYNNSASGPSIEVYKTEEYYAIYLYCVFNENISNKESLEQIKMNQKVLKNILNTITSTPDEIYNTIYNDYELDSTLSETKYTKVGDCSIKSEIMQRYVIYYLK